MHLALKLLGAGPGDEVICQSFTFVATANPIAYTGAQPVFVDSEEKTWNMDPSMLRQALEDRRKTGGRVRAVIAVDLYGMPCDFAGIRSVCSDFGIPLVEDAAEAVGSRVGNLACGSFGDAGVLSFNGNKLLTTSGGGALVSNDTSLIAKAKFLASQARDKAPHYEHSEIGYNYQLSNISAAIGRGQLKVLEQRVARRREIHNYYVRALGDIHGVSFQPEPKGCRSNRWLTAVVFEDPALPDRVMNALEKDNIESRPLWKPMHLQPLFRDAPAYVSGVSERLFRHGLCLPSGTAMTEEDLGRISGIVRKTVQG
jgi:dTDP-4-amino-4,6-dideoxygalactose transaminase